MDAETIDYKGYTLHIQYDDPESPREWDNLGTMVCSHRRYSLGDSHHDYEQTVQSMLQYSGYVSMPDLIKAIEDNEGPIVWLPLYLYDHGGITMYTTGDTSYHQHEGWDSGTVGLIYVSRAKIRKEYGVKHVSPQLLQRVIFYLKGEVTTYDEYLTGQVYGYTIDDPDGEEIDDSCWGFYGMSYCIDEAKSIVDAIVKQATEKAWQSVAAEPIDL